MKQTLLSAACFLLFLQAVTFSAVAQDVVYFNDGTATPVNTRIKDLVRGKLILTVTEEDGSMREQRMSASGILMAFTKSGNYLIISELSTDTLQAKQQIRDFLAAPPRPAAYHYLIKANPLTVIPAKEIPVDNDEVANYKTRDGNSASISKNELLAILYRDGRHWVRSQLPNVSSLLLQARLLLTDEQKPEPKPTPRPNDKNQDSQPDSKVDPAPPIDPRTYVLTDAEKEEYRQQGLQRIEDLVMYINTIADKASGDEDKKDRAIRQAQKLFVEGATVEVNSVKRPDTRTQSVRQYLTRLKLLPYASVKVEWMETVFVKDLTKEADGFYYGTIAGRQVFTAEGANGKVVYKDETDKNVRVKLESYEKVIDGQSINKFRVMLGNIRIKAD